MPHQNSKKITIDSLIMAQRRPTRVEKKVACFANNVFAMMAFGIAKLKN